MEKPNKYYKCKRKKFIDHYYMNFSMYEALEACEITLNTYKEWINTKKYEWFKNEMDEANETKFIMMEDLLIEKAQGGDTKAILYWLENNINKYNKKYEEPIVEKTGKAWHEYTVEELEKQKEQAILNYNVRIFERSDREKEIKKRDE